MSENFKTTKIFLVDAFATAFSGKSDGVCYIPGSRRSISISDDIMQIAAEMNLSETAFIQPISSEKRPTEFLLRWFTPTVG